jgi:ADP-ribose pyrophosphatase YjhB (NUDIX family)
MLKENESYEDAVVRSGHEKLGVEIRPVKLIGEGSVERETFVLHMKEYEAEIIDGAPVAPQPFEGMTQYQKCMYSSPEILKEAAIRGSLCSQIYLTSVNDKW